VSQKPFDDGGFFAGSCTKSRFLAIQDA
jgi:hypothetical protein